MTDPTFGLITRVYGTREHPVHQYLWDAFSSALAQRWWYWHHVIVDDGSTDGSAKIIEDYATRWDVKEKATAVTLRQNVGAVAAFNIAARAMPERVSWIACLDADDMIDARYLGEAAAAICANPKLNVIVAPCRHFGTAHHVHRFPRFDPRRMTESCMIPGQAIYRRELFERLGGYDETIIGPHDWDFFIRAQLAVGLVVHQLDQPRWYYRTHAGPRVSADFWEQEERYKQYWRGHTRENLGTRTWGEWLRQQQEAAA